MDTICLKISKNSYSEFGFHYNWLDHFKIELFIEDDTVIIRANKEGLESLAKHLFLLSQDFVPNHYHLHYDNMNSFEDGSNALIIEKNNE